MHLFGSVSHGVSHAGFKEKGNVMVLGDQKEEKTMKIKFETAMSTK